MIIIWVGRWRRGGAQGRFTIHWFSSYVLLVFFFIAIVHTAYAPIQWNFTLLLLQYALFFVRYFSVKWLYRILYHFRWVSSAEKEKFKRLRWTKREWENEIDDNATLILMRIKWRWNNGRWIKLLISFNANFFFINSIVFPTTLSNESFFALTHSAKRYNDLNGWTATICLLCDHCHTSYSAYSHFIRAAFICELFFLFSFNRREAKREVYCKQEQQRHRQRRQNIISHTQINHIKQWNFCAIMCDMAC